MPKKWEESIPLAVSEANPTSPPSTRMTAPAIQACLDRLVALWELLPRETRPDGFWVAQHDRLTPIR